MSKLKHIVISEDVDETLRNLGKTGMSYNDVLTQILTKRNALKTGCSCRIAQSLETQTTGSESNGYP